MECPFIHPEPKAKKYCPANGECTPDGLDDPRDDPPLYHKVHMRQVNPRMFDFQPDPLPDIGAMVIVAYSHPCVEARGLCGQVIGRSGPSIRVRLMSDPQSSSVSLSQMTLNAARVGLTAGQFRTVPADRTTAVMAAHKAFKSSRTPKYSEPD